MNASINIAVYSEQGKAIKCDFKPGSVGRSKDLDKKVYLKQRLLFELPVANKI
jgi:hypothetical protein